MVQGHYIVFGIVVYSVLVETGLNKTKIGKTIMSCTFITDISTALHLSILFIKPNFYTLIFIVVSIVLIFLATKFSHLVFDHPALKNKVIGPEIKYLFLLLLLFMYFANIGNGQAVLPTFVLGLLMSKHFKETSQTKVVQTRLRTVAYAIITPAFFIVGGMRVSIPLIATTLGLFFILFFMKFITKFIGVFFFARKYIPQGAMNTTLLMSTGLTFGTITAVIMTAIRVTKAIKQKLNLDGLNLIQANGIAAGQTIPHFHLHLVPRYKSDGLLLEFGHGKILANKEELENMRIRLTPNYTQGMYPFPSFPSDSIQTFISRADTLFCQT